MADVKTLPEALKEIRKALGVTLRKIVADRGFDQLQEEQEKLKKRWKLKRMVIPKKGKKPHPDYHRFWFKKGLKERKRGVKDSEKGPSRWQRRKTNPARENPL